MFLFFRIRFLALFSFLQYSLIAANALRGVLKEEFKVAALRREGVATVKFAKWEGGKQLPSSTSRACGRGWERKEGHAVTGSVRSSPATCSAPARCPRVARRPR